MKFSPALIIFLSFLLLVQLSQVPKPSLQWPALSNGSIHALALPANQPILPVRTQYADLASNLDNKAVESMVFIGDVLMARHVEVLMKRWGSDYPFLGSTWLQDQSSIVFANFESSVASTHKITPPYQMRFSTNPVYLPALAASGITHVSLANNHSLDFGVEGYENAVLALETVGLNTAGCSQSVRCENVSYSNVAGLRIAVVALTALELGVTPSAKNSIREASNNSDVQIVYVHWGNEYILTHSQAQYNQAKAYIDAGADLIIGHHPHVVQDVQLVDGVPVFYSLGNYIFDQYQSQAVREGLALKIQWRDKPSIELIPVSSVGTLGQPQVMTGDQKAVFLYELSQRSDKSLATYLRQGQLPLLLNIASPVKTAMISQ